MSEKGQVTWRVVASIFAAIISVLFGLWIGAVADATEAIDRKASVALDVSNQNTYRIAAMEVSVKNTEKIVDKMDDKIDKINDTVNKLVK